MKLKLNHSCVRDIFFYCLTLSTMSPTNCENHDALKTVFSHVQLIA